MSMIPVCHQQSNKTEYYSASIDTRSDIPRLQYISCLG